MTDRTGDPARAASSLTRRTVLRVAAVLPLLGEGPAGVAGSTAAGAESPTPGADLVRDADALSLDGTTALLGVPPSTGTGGPTAGRAVVVERGAAGWLRRATLAPGGVAGQFGRATALDGDTAVVGAPLGSDPTGDHAGSATVFAREDGEWDRRATLTDPESTDVDLFGTAVAVSGDTVVVGASRARSDGGRRTGSATVFRRAGDGWDRTATLSPGREEVREFGRAVALDGDAAVVGARRTGGSRPGDRGTALVYTRSGHTWRRAATLTPETGDRDDAFGTHLAMADGTVAVGAPRETNRGGLNAGAVHVFARRARDWRRQATLRDETGGPTGRFGTGVALDGERALVGSAGAPTGFRRSVGTWTREAELDAGERLRAASGVALDGARAVVLGDDAALWADLGTGTVEAVEP